MIYCFSGTGNTLYAAERLALLLDTQCHVFTPEELREPENNVFESSDKIIIWAFPTYSWGVPPVIRKVLRFSKFRFSPHAVHLGLTSCGDDVGNLAEMFHSDLKKRGVIAGAVFSVRMPNTYVMMKGFDTDSEELEKRKIKELPSRLEEIANKIKQRVYHKNDVVKGSFACLKTRVIYPWFIRHAMSPKGFNVDGQICLHCGKCADACPMDNIVFNKERVPEWGDKCAFCTACYQICPVHAINWKKATIGKGQWYFGKDKNGSIKK